MSKDGFHQTGSVLLDCLHSVTITVPLPVKGESQYCRRCGDYRTVKESHESYMVKCNTGKCKLNRSAGTDKDKALAIARRHVEKYSRHRVTVFDGRLSVAEVTNTDETLFVTAEERSVIAANSQKLLRNLGLGATGKPDSVG